MAEPLALWTIYDRPVDYPGKLVARLWLIEDDGASPSGLVYLGDDLEAVRAMLPDGITRLPRQPGDDPLIVESWLEDGRPETSAGQ